MLGDPVKKHTEDAHAPLHSALEKAEERLRSHEPGAGDKTPAAETTRAEQAAPTVTIPEQEYTTLKQQAQELAELRDRLLRQVADFENAKKRLAREKEEYVTFANEQLIREFLPMLDHLDLALSHAETAPQALEALVSGMQLIKKDLADNLKAHGLEVVEAKGKPFNPHVHESVGCVETCEVPEDTVVDEVQAGYVLKGKLIRPTKVRIARHGVTGVDDASTKA